MEQSADPWSIDPSQLLKPGDMLNNNYNNKKKALYTPESDSNIFLNNNDNINNPNEIDDPLGMNYYDIDKFLTQELRDLDIPMIPITQDTSVNFEDQFNWDASNNNGNNLNYNTMNYDTSMTQSQTMPSHKRGMSGTAIFGFQNHNKTLSIASLQRSGMENGPNNNNNNNNIFNNNNNNNKSKNNNENGIHGDANEIIEQDDEVSQLILRQQEELRLALEKQKMVNQKLQEQLRANQLQQERLQRALEEQNDPQTTNNTDAAPSPQRSIRTPARPASGEALIITSNSADGKYQFPPPSMISPALTNTSLNGSPSKRSGAKARNPMFSMSTSSVQSSTSPSKYSNNIQSTEDSIPNLFKSMNEEEPKQHNGIDALNSPFFTTSPSNRHQRHKKKESVVSTVSTIPLSACDSDTESSSPQRLVGLGLTMENNNNNNNSNENKITSRRSPMRIDVMPTIPASTENTPIKDPTGGDNHLNAPNSIPRKHLFQHTPVKQRPEYVIINNNNTPILNPPPSFPILSPGNINNNNNIYHRTTLSPRFNGERNYILESPPMPPPVEPHLGPMKITRKPTTLPRGSIDQYVKELPDKQFECLYPNCGKTFKRRYNIRSHIQTHLEDRPYTCDHPGCKKAFVRNHDLVRHKKSHFNKILSCPCGKKFADEELLIQHRDRMVCQNGTRPEKMMVGKGNNISTSPRRNVVGGSTITTPLGSPNKKSTRDGSESPIKRSMDADHTGYVRNKLEEQLFYQQNEQYLEPDGLSFPVLTPSPPSGLSDLGE